MGACWRMSSVSEAVRVKEMDMKNREPSLPYRTPPLASLTSHSTLVSFLYKFVKLPFHKWLTNAVRAVVFPHLPHHLLHQLLLCVFLVGDVHESNHSFQQSRDLHQALPCLTGSVTPGVINDEDAASEWKMCSDNNGGEKWDECNSELLGNYKIISIMHKCSLQVTLARVHEYITPQQGIHQGHFYPYTFTHPTNSPQ